MAVSALDPVTVDAFLAMRRAAGYSAGLRGGSLRPLLEYLQAAGVVPVAEPVRAATTAVDVLLSRYGGYLAVERGLAQSTIARNVELVRPF